MEEIITNIRNAINALRMRTTPSSITPQDIASILQALLDFVQALSLAPQSEIINLNQQLTQALNAANNALTVASGANENASNQHITQFDKTQSSSTVTITLKQAGSAVLSLQLPPATAAKAGLLSKDLFNKIASLETGLEDNNIDSVDVSSTTQLVKVKLVKHDETEVEGQIEGASRTKAGVMTAADYQRFDSLPLAGVIAQTVASGALKNLHAFHVLLRNLGADSYGDDPLEAGENYFEDGQIFHATSGDPIQLGAPSKELIYIHQATDAIYRWDGIRFVPLVIDPNAGLKTAEVRVYSASSKRYDIPPGVLAVVKATTDTVNIALLQGVTDRVTIHRILFQSADCASVVDGGDNGIRWPNTIHWDESEAPTLQHVTAGYGVLVEIIDGKWGSFKYY